MAFPLVIVQWIFNTALNIWHVTLSLSLSLFLSLFLISLCLCLFISFYLSLSLSRCLYVSPFLSVCVCVCVFLSVSVSFSAYLSLNVLSARLRIRWLYPQQRSNNLLKKDVLGLTLHHHHLVVPPARISLTLSRHSSQSFNASGGSSGLHPVSSQSCCM